MNKLIFALLTMLVTMKASAEDWVCKTQSSVSRGPNSILACGIGESDSEAEARDLAYSNAMTEFRRVCDVSDDCRGQAVTVRPSRTECDATDDGFKCYRAVSISIEERAESLDLEIEKQQRKLAAVQEAKAKEEKLDFANLELKFARPNPTYWSMGIGVFVGSTALAGTNPLMVGYGLNLKRCFKDIFCPHAGLTVGKLVFRDPTVEGNYLNGYAGVSMFLYKRLYIYGNLGLEYQGSAIGSTFGPTTNLGLGVEVVRVQNVSISTELGAKGGPWNQINSAFNLFGNFKF